MSDVRDRLPGDRLRKLLARVVSVRVLDEVVIPALADLQHERAQAHQASAWRRALVSLRGYVGIWSALALCLATWPARSLRRDWLAAEAAGPQLLRTLAPRACAFGLGFTLLIGTQGPYREAAATRDPWSALLLLPSVLTVVVPLALFFGLVLALGRLRTRSRVLAGTRSLGAVLGLSMAAALLTFGLGGWVTPEANQSFRERVAARLLGRRGTEGAISIPKGARELTLGELLARRRAAPESGGATLALDVEWHKKWAIPATCLVFGPLALGLAGLPNRRRLPSAVAVACMATFAAWGALRFGEQAALSGRIGPLPVIWTGNVLLALLACWLIARHRSSDESARVQA